MVIRNRAESRDRVASSLRLAVVMVDVVCLLALGLILIPAAAAIVHLPQPTRIQLGDLCRIPADPGRYYSRIQVLGDGSLYFQRHFLASEPWREASIEEDVVVFASIEVAKNPSQRFLLVFDRETRWSCVEWVLDALGQAKVNTVRFSEPGESIESLESWDGWFTRPSE